MSSCDDSGESECTENGDSNSSDTWSSNGDDKHLKVSLPLQPLSLTQNSGKSPEELTDKPPHENHALKRSESDNSFLNFLSKSPRKIYKNLSSLSPKSVSKPKSLISEKSDKLSNNKSPLKKVESNHVHSLNSENSIVISPTKHQKISLASLTSKTTSKPKRRVTVNEYPQSFRLASAPHSPVASRSLDADFRKKSSDLLYLNSGSRSRSLETHYRSKKLELSPYFNRQDKKQEKKRLRSISFLSRAPYSSSRVDPDSLDEADESAGRGRKIFKIFTSSAQRKRSTPVTPEELAIKSSMDPSTSQQHNLGGSLVKSGLSLPDESILHDSSPTSDMDRSSPQNSENIKYLEEQQTFSLLKQKIIKTSEMIGKERTNQDENIAEYLKLITNADKQQTIRIKAVFDKKNQKSLATIEKQMLFVHHLAECKLTTL